MSTLRAAQLSGDELRSDTNRESHHVHGGQYAPLEGASNNMSDMTTNVLMMHGDMVNALKFLTYATAWPLMNQIPVFESFNGVSGTICGVQVTSMGLKANRVAEKTLDKEGAWEAKWTIEAGLALLASALAKVVGSIMWIANTFRALPAALVSWIDRLGVVNGVFTMLMFAGYVVRAGIREREVMRFRDEFRLVLQAVMPFATLPEKGTPKELFEMAVDNLCLDKDDVARSVLEHMQEKMRAGDEGVESKAVLVNKLEGLMNRKGRSFFKLHSGILRMDDASDMLTAAKNVFRGDEDALKCIEVLKAEWNDRVNYENLLARATKADLVTEVRSGRRIDPKKGESARAVLDHLFAKWTERRNWNRALGAVSLFAIVMVALLFTVAPGPVFTVVCGILVGLFVVFALFFDGPGIGACLKSEPKKWDLPVLAASTLLAIGLTAVFAVTSFASGGILPLIYVLVVGGMLLLVQCVALGWVAYRTLQVRREKAEQDRIVAARLGNSVFVLNDI